MSDLISIRKAIDENPSMSNLDSGERDLEAVQRWLWELRTYQLDSLIESAYKALRYKVLTLEHWQNAAQHNAQLALSCLPSDDCSEEKQNEILKRQEAFLRCRMRVIAGEKPKPEDYVPFVGEKNPSGKRFDPLDFVVEGEFMLKNQRGEE